MRRPTIGPETGVGLAGSVLLTAAYLGVGVVRSYSVPVESAEWFPLLGTAFLVGGVVAVAANRLVPADRRTRRRHAKTAVLMAVLPMVVLVGTVAALFLMTAGLLETLHGVEQLVTESGGFGGAVAVFAFAWLVVVVILVVFIAVGVFVGGLVLNSSAVAGYALVTAVLEQSEGTNAGESTGPEPPDGHG
jgi:sterol desaturase/sphingolipid hydroxylase (fatty acid hydroxylase superfamily)